MQDYGLEDELVERLARTREDGSPEFDPTLAAIRFEIDSLSEALKTPPEDNPFASEPELASALEVASSLPREAPAEPTRSDRSSTGMADEQGPVVLGQYELQEKLGSGGMGTVYRAVHRKLNRTVALKVLPQDRFQTPDAVARFEREMQAVGMLQHPNIVAAHDAGEVDGCHFLVMELVDGEDIGQLLSRTGPLPIAEACEIVRQAALGLQHIFENGLVHRDIKPSNLMLASPRQRKGEPTVKILDLGLALLDPNQLGAARELTSTGQVMGTVDYMAPEQGLDTHSVDIRADLYSLGATLYKLLTGRAPLEDPKYNSMMKRLIALDRDEPPLLTSRRPDCPAELSDFIHRLLSKSPDERPEQPQAVADFLMLYAQGADLRALQQGSAETLKRWVVANPEVPTVTTTPQTPTQISKSRPSAPPKGPGHKSRRWWWAAALPIVLLLGLVLHITTDNGTVTIAAPDDLKENVTVSVLRNGTPVVENWIIKPGVNEHRIQTGTVEVRLTANPDDEFGLHPPGDLVVRRRGEVAYRLIRRPPPQSVAGVSESAELVRNSPKYALDFSEWLNDDFAALVDVPLLMKPNEPFTVELYATPRTVHDVNSMLWHIHGNWLLKMNGTNAVNGGSIYLFAGTGQQQYDMIHKPHSAKPQQRLHVAAMSDGKAMTLYIDGKFAGSKPITRTLPETPLNSQFGGNSRSPTSTPFNGTMDSARISKGVRYTSNFTPSELTADADTLVLYRFDEGSGDVIRDLSGNHHHGKIKGAKWVRVGEPRASATGVLPLNSSNERKTPVADAPGSPQTIAEPPPLEDWLKGRTILTVAQDGSGQFQTIQAALDALQPGQVIKVVDHGPYREQLSLAFIPADTGLISSANTVIELPSWPDEGEGTAGKTVAHAFGGMSGFRMSGFLFRSPPRQGLGALTSWSNANGLILEDCCFWPEELPGMTGRTNPIRITLTEKHPQPGPIVVRRCDLRSGQLLVSGDDRELVLDVHHNYFRGKAHAFFQIARLKRLRFHENVCEFEKGSVNIRGLRSETYPIVLTSNTMAGPFLFKDNAAIGSVTVRNNLFRGLSQDDVGTSPVTDGWNIGSNFTLQTTLAPFSELKPQEGNLPQAQFLSLDPAQPDYLRIAADSLLAATGHGEDLPNYIGALPPGPAPSDGDWFTRLRERWSDSGPP